LARCRSTLPSTALSPYTWKSGSTPSTTSSPWIIGGSTCAAWSMLAISARWVSIAARGRPEVPLV
jgi:hypothetical protein